MKEGTEKNKEPSSEEQPEETPPAPKKKQSVGGILFRVITYSVFFIFLLVASAGLVLEYYFPAEEARKIAEDQLTEKLQLPLKIQKLGFSLLSGMQLDGVAIGSSSSPVARVKKVVLDYDLTQLVQGKLVINQILVDQPQLTAVSKNGTWNFQPLLELEKTPSSDKDKTLPAFPLAEVNIKEVMIRQASAHLDQDGKLSAQIEGLSLEARGKASYEDFDLKLKILMNPGTAPNIRFQSNKHGSFQSNLFSNLEFSASDLKQLSVSGALGLQKTQRDASLLPDVAVKMDAGVSLQPETLNLKKLWLSLGKNNHIHMSGRVNNFSHDPSFKLMIDKASFQLKDLLDLEKKWPLSGKGLLKAKAIKVRGQLARFVLKNLNIDGGTLATENLWVNHPDQNIQLENMNTSIELKEVALENSQLANASLNINMQLKKAVAQKAEIKDWKQSLSLNAKGKDNVLWEFDTDMRSLHYDHPEAKEIYLPVHVNGSGHLKKSDLNNLKFSYRLGTLANGAVTGTVKNFGKDSVQLEQNLSMNLAKVASRLPKKFTTGLAESFKGTAKVQTSVTGMLGENFLPTRLTGQANLELAGLTAHLKQPSLKINNLNTLAAFPLEFHADKGLRIARLELNTELQNAEALETWKINTLKLDTKLGAKGFHKLKSGTLPIKMDTRITLANLDGPALSLTDLKSETKLKTDLLPDDVRNTRIEGNLSFENLSARQMLKTDGWFSRFNLDVHDKSLTRVRLSQKTQINKPSFHQDGMIVGLKSVNLETTSRQNLQQGDVNLDTLLLKIPDMVNARLKATIKEWGKDFAIDGKMQALQLASLWDILPDTLKSEHENLQAGGTLDASLKVKGGLPTNEDTSPLLTLTSASTKAEVLLSNGSVNGLVLDDKNISAESLNLKTRLIFENGTGDLSGNFSGKLAGLADFPLSPEFDFSYALKNLNSLKIKQHQLKLTGKGMNHSLTGHINGLKPFIEGRYPTNFEKLLNKLYVKLASTNTLDITQATSDELSGGLKAQGVITSKTLFQQSAGKTLNLKGSVGVDKFSLSLPSGIVLDNLNGTFPYTKTLNLDPEQLQDKSIGFSPAQKKFFTPLRNFSRYKNIIRAESLEVKGQTLKDIGLDVVFKDNRLMAEKFIFDALGGTMAGNLFLIQNRQGPVIKFSTEFAGIDSSKLLTLPTEKNVDSQIDGNLQVELKIHTGLEDQEVSLDQLSVNIAITRIGAQTLDRLLLFLDPEESKPAIMDTRAKLKLATPHRVKLVLKNGNLNVEAWLKSDLLGIIKAPELKRVPVAGLKRFNTIHENLQTLKGLEQISSYLSARGLQFDEGKMILHY